MKRAERSQDVSMVLSRESLEASFGILIGTICSVLIVTVSHLFLVSFGPHTAEFGVSGMVVWGYPLRGSI